MCIRAPSSTFLRVGSKMILSGFHGGNFPSFIHFWANIVAHMQLSAGSELDCLKQTLDTHLRVCSGEEEDSRRRCVAK